MFAISLLCDGVLTQASTEREMFLHYYGQDGARLNRDQSVHIVKQEIPRPTYWFMLVSFWLFYMPCVYRQKFNEVFVDSLLNEGHWSQLLENLRKDWEMTVTPVRAFACV